MALFLAITVLTSVTEFFFPRDQLLPSHVLGLLSLAVLAVAVLARYVYRLARSWRWIYVEEFTREKSETIERGFYERRSTSLPCSESPIGI